MIRSSMACLLLSAALLWGCGDEVTKAIPGSGGAGGSTTSSSSNGGSGAGGGLTGEWELLMQTDWSLVPATEDYLCLVAEVPQDIYVGAFRPIAPVGTHHTVLTRISSGPAGLWSCDAFTNGENQIYGSGVNTNPLHFPEGIAVKLQKGEFLLLNLHLFNSSASELTGTSGIEIIRIDPADVQAEAELTLAGTLDISIPPQSPGSAIGFCTLDEAQTLFAVAPHMHQYGKHQTITVEQASGDTVVYDAPYSFEDQRVTMLDPPIEIAPGDRLRVDCSYENPTSDTVTWGDSSLQEMCFGTLALYPATGISYFCLE